MGVLGQNKYAERIEKTNTYGLCHEHPQTVPDKSFPVQRPRLCPKYLSLIPTCELPSNDLNGNYWYKNMIETPTNPCLHQSNDFRFVVSNEQVHIPGHIGTYPPNYPPCRK